MIANSKRLSPMRAENFSQRSDDILSPIKEQSQLIALQTPETSFRSYSLRKSKRLPEKVLQRYAP